MILGRVVSVNVKAELVNERFHVDDERLLSIGHICWMNDCRTTDLFKMPRGRKALDIE